MNGIRVQRKCLGLLYATVKCKQYTLGRPVTVYTDHVSRMRVTNLQTLNQRLQRWSLRLSEVSPQTQHLPRSVLKF